MRTFIVLFAIGISTATARAQLFGPESLGGAALGAIIGAAAGGHHPGRGAAIGAGVGLVAGALAGETHRHRYAYHRPEAVYFPPTPPAHSAIAPAPASHAEPPPRPVRPSTPPPSNMSAANALFGR